ncbi:MAG: hypothetical protein AB7F19_06705 [Candidatus Babeliales bacterium]
MEKLLLLAFATLIGLQVCIINAMKSTTCALTQAVKANAYNEIQALIEERPDALSTALSSNSANNDSLLAITTNIGIHWHTRKVLATTVCPRRSTTYYSMLHYL